jgi:hypothetical protein
LGSHTQEVVVQKVPTDLWFAAYHEAGHAVAVDALGGVVTEMDVLRLEEPEEARWGITKHLAMPWWSPERKLRARIQSALSGSLATERAFGDTHGDDSDLEQLIEVCLAFDANWTANELIRIVRHFERRARLLIDCNWSAVESLAETHIRRKTLPSKEAHEIMTAAFLAQPAAIHTHFEGELESLIGRAVTSGLPLSISDFVLTLDPCFKPRCPRWETIKPEDVAAYLAQEDADKAPG